MVLCEPSSPWKALAKKAVAVLALALGTWAAQAQTGCVTTPACTPGPASSPQAGLFGGGLRNINLNSTNFASAGASQGYINLNCNQAQFVTIGTPIPFSTTHGSTGENLRVWADLDGDGAFNPTTEQVFASTSAATSHSGSIILPFGTVTDTIRLRFSSDLNLPGASIPTPCSTPLYGQARDFALIVLPNVLKPLAQFSASDTLTCSGTVNFTDQSLNLPSSWAWDFGDGIGTSTAQNPTYVYSTPGVYTVTLIVGNPNGQDTLERVNYVRYSTNVPVPAICTPITTAPCCGYGVRNLVYGTINTTSLPFVTGYRDLTCGTRTDLVIGKPYQLDFEGSTTQNQDVRIYLDRNRDGDFSASELIFSRNNVLSISTPITLTGADLPLDTALRMRIVADAVGSPLSGCGNLSAGQAVDFTVIVRANTLPPVARFTATANSACDSVYTFESQSENNIDSLVWDFGDGTKLTTTNTSVQYEYNQIGTYDVKLKVYGPFGVDSLIQVGAVNYVRAPRRATCNSTTRNPQAQIGILSVSLGTTTITSGYATEGNRDFTCQASIMLDYGQSYVFTVLTSPNSNEYVKAWIDFNNDGVFANNEQIYATRNGGLRQTHSANITFNQGGVVYNTPLRLRIVDDFAQAPTNGLTACGQLGFGQQEDYSVTFVPLTVPPTARFGANLTNTCFSNIQFSDSSLNAPTSWLWTFGDGNTSTAQNPTHTYAAPGVFTVKLKVTNAFGSDSLERVNYITLTNGQGLLAPFCTTTTTTLGNFGIGPNRVSFANLVHSSSTNTGRSYWDFACSQVASVMAGSSYPITVNTSNANNESVRVYVDWNANGILETSELAFSTSNVRATHTGSIVVPGTAVIGTRLRMRVLSDIASGSDFSPCANLSLGHADDYGVMVSPNTNPPITRFGSPIRSSCNGTIAFIDSSTNAPTSWLWTFGDGNTSTQQNPTHTYTAVGTYTVKLKVTNSIGSDSLEKVNYITITSTDGPKTTCVPRTIGYQQNTNMGISRVQLGSIDRTSGNASEGYRDFACTDSTSLPSLASSTLLVTTGPSINETVTVYIDWDNSGTFTSNEQIGQSVNRRVNHSILIAPPSTGVVLNTFLRMRIISEFPSTASTTPIDGCYNSQLSQTEDYAVRFKPVVGLAERITLGSLRVYPNPGQNVFQVALPEGTEQGRLHIVNLLGQVVKSQDLSQAETPIDLSQAGSGVYFFRLETAQGTFQQRVVNQ